MSLKSMLTPTQMLYDRRIATDRMTRRCARTRTTHTRIHARHARRTYKQALAAYFCDDTLHFTQAHIYREECWDSELATLQKESTIQTEWEEMCKAAREFEEEQHMYDYEFNQYIEEEHARWEAADQELEIQAYYLRYKYELE